ncbi:MAG: insulinase family protein [Chloroflexi bacterium]|nr:insulinase family protein [Chloroflexota bacterium]MCL5273656.1 insulinase family protein [Chloroflexota bacterium]
MPKTKTPKLGASLPCAANIAQYRLDNGMCVYVYENFASPAIVMSGYLIAGARDETPDKAGLASFTAECLMRGAGQYTYEQIFEETEAIGANLSVSSGMHTTGFFAKSLAEDMPLMCDLLSDVLRRPTFPADEMEKERNEWISGLEERANSTRAMAGLAFSELCYPDNHPYHYSSDGTMETSRAITRDDVLNFHRAYFSPQDMVVCVVGAVNAAAARDRVEAAFGDWRGERPARAAMPPAPRISGRPSRHIAMPGKSQTNLLWGYPGPSRLEPDWISCSLMNSILGQFGMYGRLGESVRKEEGLVYYIGSRFEGGVGPGSWYIYAGTNPKTVERVVDISVDEVRRIQRRKVTAQELEDNKSYFTGVLPLQMESNEGMAGQIINMVRYDLGLDYLLRYPDLVNAITLDDVRASARKWLDADNFVLTSAGS